ncbi:caspase family protein [Bradyrhizobium liaoningense]|uniref:caspase family protein n=1 Tax=Bradyrhizobium liaoningense TaxID=43992 RepID=UPI001BAD1B1F|nr:caspase family protein [Bradyrhizobium liaoningense]MBR0855765.1 caspase family protein [Bradyrhizobium liaoningense]
MFELYRLGINACGKRREVSKFPALVRRAILLGLVALSILVAAQPPASAGERIALVVGNSDYRMVPKLANPANDAADMANALGRLGYTVKHLVDLDYNHFRQALIDFGNAAKSADKAVIFFAGHGVEIDGKNWLIPVDAAIKSEIDVYAEAINLETLIDISVMPKVIGLVVLDACRNDPFKATNVAAAGRTLVSRSTPAKGSAERSSRASGPPAPIATDMRGLAPVEVSDNVLVAFAAAAGTTASDGAGRNSPYSGSLLRHVETPQLEINYLFRIVHDEVWKETGTQEPAIYGTLPKADIYLNGDAAVAMVDDGADVERVAWEFVRSTNEIATLRRFAEQFPAGLHTAEINDRIAQLKTAEENAWTIVERQKSLAAYRAYLDLYPYGEHVENARVTLASLEKSVRSGPAGGQVDMPGPPPASYQLASADTTAGNSESVEKAWDVLKESRDQSVVGRFAERYPSLRHNRLPPGSDLALRPVNSTDWMLRTSQDSDVNACFDGDAGACATSVKKYPDYVQLQFQLCRSKGNPKGCMINAVTEARKRGLLVSAYTRSEEEKVRNREYRRVVARVHQNVGNVVSGVVSNVVGNVVSNAVSASVSAAASNAAASAASRAASASASHAASRAASSAASGAASRSASSAASSAASKAASSAASNAASRVPIPSDVRLKEDITALADTGNGLRLYRYRYRGDATFYVGVMAQEVAQLVPAAVSRGMDGYLQVDYVLLGLEFLTYRDWIARHSHSALH